MSFKFRRFLFYALFLFFSFASLGTIMYADGWRIDFKSFSIKKTGGLYIETVPRNAVIEINNERFPNRSGFIKSGTLITNLLPKTYEIKISHDGYFPYHKNILIKPSLVTELINVILIPLEIEKNIFSFQKIKGNEIADFSESGKKFIVKNKNKIYYLHNLNDSSAALNVNMALNNVFKDDAEREGVKKAIFHPFDSSRLIIEAVNLYILDPYRGKLEYVFKNMKNNRLIAWSAKNSSIYYIKQKTDGEYLLSSFNLMTKTENDIFEFFGIEIKKIMKISVADSGNDIAVINELGDVYILNAAERSIKKIAHDAKIFSFSPDGEKIAFIDNDGKLSIYFLKNQFKNNFKKAGETARFNLENKELIENIYWHKDSHHLFIKRADKTVFFTEIDDRLPLNQYLIFGGVENFYYNLKSGTAYFIKNAALSGIDL